MPPRTRTRATKVLKENIDILKKNTPQAEQKVPKHPRKVLGDKTNSLSDDNASIDIPIKTSKKALKIKAAETNKKENVRPRRDRRLPQRYVENHALKELSAGKDSLVKKDFITGKSDIIAKIYEKSLHNEAHTKDTKSIPKANTPKQVTNSIASSVKALKSNKQKPTSARPVKNGIQNNEISLKDVKITATTRPRRTCRLQSARAKVTSTDSISIVSSPFKTPPKNSESSFFANRPKRISRLPSRFEDHSISPNKFIPVQPCYASTPILKKSTKTITKNTKTGNFHKETQTKTTNKTVDKLILKNSRKTKPIQTDANADSSSSSIDKSSPDSNNNGKNKIVRAKRANLKTTSQTSQVNHEVDRITPFARRLLDNSLSFRILEDKNQSNKKDNDLDIYEFTFDPNEEPPPQKKKRKKTVKKRPPKPKIMTLKSNYNDNLSKALATLKNKIKPPIKQKEPVQSNVKLCKVVENVKSTQAITNFATNEDIPHGVNISSTLPPSNESVIPSIHESNYASICVEDIAADVAPSDHHGDINYSPVNSPNHPPITEVPEANESQVNHVLNKDPLNLQADLLSFFEEPPVASSSMNVSTPHPLASPWRVEFGNLPMKWHSDTYVKPNMTPAVECSFINSEDTLKKKHVYTNMVTEEPLPEIEDSTPNLKQPSIISFMREVAEKNANKKKRGRSVSPTKANSIFCDLTDTSKELSYQTPKKAKKTANGRRKSTDISNEKENSNELSNQSISAHTAPTKDKDCTYFGFDDIEDVDQENVSPVKVVPNTRARNLKTRAVLKQLNTQAGPTRAIMPVAAKTKLTSSEVVEQLYDQLKSAEDAAQFPEKETAKEPTDNTVVDDPSWHENQDDDSQSVHLFEDIEVVHHLKPHRKSYGKAKKVTFPTRPDSDSDSQPPVAAKPDESDEDNLSDLTFQMPDVKPKKTMKKKKPKKLLTKKEEKEVEEWAAGFNSMCEDIEEFPLVVE